MKQVSGYYWVEHQENSILAVGLTPEYLKRLGIIWNLIPTRGKKVCINMPFLHLESSNCLTCLRSPIDGEIVKWNDNLYSPDRITEDDALVYVKVSQ